MCAGFCYEYPTYSACVHASSTNVLHTLHVCMLHLRMSYILCMCACFIYECPIYSACVHASSTNVLHTLHVCMLHLRMSYILYMCACFEYPTYSTSCACFCYECPTYSTCVHASSTNVLHTLHVCMLHLRMSYILYMCACFEYPTYSTSCVHASEHFQKLIINTKHVKNAKNAIDFQVNSTSAFPHFLTVLM